MNKVIYSLIALVLVFSHYAHPHYDKCYQGSEGYTCTLTHYTFGDK